MLLNDPDLPIASIGVSSVNEYGWPTYTMKLPLEETHFDGLMSDPCIKDDHYEVSMRYDKHFHRAAPSLPPSITPQIVSDMFAVADKMYRGIGEFELGKCSKSEVKSIQTLFFDLYAIAESEQARQRRATKEATNASN